jgi:primosomal protein N' (replication factor Y)
MLAKGHDFPMVTLVGVVNADQGLFGMDFHSTETMMQQIVQVSGRAGRAKNPGKVLIQTHFPQHPLYAYICKHDYGGFARQELKLRQQAGFPPYHYLSVIRAWAPDERAPMKYLIRIRQLCDKLRDEYPMVNIMEPVYSPMAKLNNLYRAQLLLTSPSRAARQQFLQKWIRLIECYKHKKPVRWSIDVDPLDLY